MAVAVVLGVVLFVVFGLQRSIYSVTEKDEKRIAVQAQQQAAAMQSRREVDQGRMDRANKATANIDFNQQKIKNVIIYSEGAKQKSVPPPAPAR